MNKPFLVDSDVLIDYPKAIDLACDLMETHIDRIGRFVITIAEIGAGIKWKEEKQSLEQFLSAIPRYDMTPAITEMGSN